MSQLKVTFDGSIYTYQIHGGITRCYDELLPRICSLQPAVEITFLTTRTRRHSLPRHPGIKELSLPDMSFRIPWPRPILRRIEPPLGRAAFSASVLLSCGVGEGSIWHSPSYRLPSRWRGPTVVTLHDMAPELFPEIYSSPSHQWHRRLKAQCLRRADLVICVSRTTQEDAVSVAGIPKEKTVVVHHAASSTFRPLPEFPIEVEAMGDGPFLLHLGNRSANKNFGLLLRAYSMWSLRSDVRLIVVGSGWSAQESELLEKHQLFDHVVLLPHVSDLELCQLYNKASAFVFPSLYEGFGIPILEAMASGCPIVASRIPSTLEIAGHCPIYFRPNSVEELCDALDLAINEGRNSDRVQKGLEISKQYSWTKSASKTLSLYDDILLGNP